MLKKSCHRIDDRLERYKITLKSLSQYGFKKNENLLLESVSINLTRIFLDSINPVQAFRGSAFKIFVLLTLRILIIESNKSISRSGSFRR